MESKDIEVIEEIISSLKFEITVLRDEIDLLFKEIRNIKNEIRMRNDI